MKNNELQLIKKSLLNLNLFELDPLLDKNYSNTLEIYDLAGKFLYDKHNKYLQKASAEETEFTRITTYKNITLKISVTAANIERYNKKTKQRVFVFPGAREEIIEDVLRKIATEKKVQAYELKTNTHNNSKFVGVNFTLYEIYEELKRVGKSYSYTEIKEALQIMNRSILSIQSTDNSIDLSAPFFPIVFIADREKKQEARSIVCFHPMITDVILTLNFRRYNYKKALSFKRHYTRLTYKRLCHRWIQASTDKPYTILLSTLIQSMKNPYKNLYQDKSLFKKVMDDLIEEKILNKYIMSAKKEGKKIVDWKFVLYPTIAFSKQISANNKSIQSSSMIKNNP